jgi:5-(carboxyamino)imidazole ribonucleotide mutase
VRRGGEYRFDCNSSGVPHQHATNHVFARKPEQDRAFIRREHRFYIAKGSEFMPRKVAVIMGSISDLETVKPAIRLLGELGIPNEAHVYSAHRSPAQAADFAGAARANGFGAIIAAAGMAAHLAGALAAQTTLPVIGVPVKASRFDGLDALLSTVQMPPGIPVATVAVDGAYNAAMLAAQILAVEDTELAQKLAAQREQMRQGVLAKDTQLQSLLNS